jgi:hypothetical protein
MMSKGCVLTFTPEGAPRTVQPSIANFASQSRVCSAIVEGSLSFHKAAGSRLGGCSKGQTMRVYRCFTAFLPIGFAGCCLIRVMLDHKSGAFIGNERLAGKD